MNQATVLESLHKTVCKFVIIGFYSKMTFHNFEYS